MGPRRRHGDRLAIDPGLDRDEITGLGEIGRALDGLERVQRIGARVSIVAPGGDVECPLQRLGEPVGTGREREHGLGGPGDTIGIRQGHPHGDLGVRLEIEEAAHEVGRVDADEGMGGLEDGPTRGSELEGRRRIAVVVAADREHDPRRVEVAEALEIDPGGGVLRCAGDGREHQDRPDHGVPAHGVSRPIMASCRTDSP
jgi:hypothetical protein